MISKKFDNSDHHALKGTDDLIKIRNQFRLNHFQIEKIQFLKHKRAQLMSPFVFRNYIF
ncbi:calcium-binding protein [Paenibacillus polymyxa]|uniref:calcium-binding protein n=1 Tax=Paenibacillus polymyxa TaxID=1406 RepID=UPI003593D948